MRAMAVIKVEEGLKMSSAQRGVWVGAGVSPFAERGLDEAFGFAVGAWGVRPGELVLDAESMESGGEAIGAVAGSVVGEEALDGDGEAKEVSQSGVKKAQSAGGRLVRPDLSESEAGVVVDGDMDVLVTRPDGVRGWVSGDAHAWAHKTSEALNVEMEQITWRGVLVALDGGRRIEVMPVVKVVAAQEPRDSSLGESSETCDLESGQAMLLAQGEYDGHLRRWRLARRAQGPRGAIAQARGALDGKAVAPLGGSARADLEGRRGGLQGQRKGTQGGEGEHESFSTTQAQACIGVNVHALGVEDGLSGNSQSPNSPPHEQPIETSHLPALRAIASLKYPFCQYD
jgi:hypothetical protein